VPIVGANPPVTCCFFYGFLEGFPDHELFSLINFFTCCCIDQVFPAMFVNYNGKSKIDYWMIGFL
jgi:hypothetical protein